MKANELMIGDWVFDKAVSDKPVQIEQINEQNVHYKFGNGYVSSGVELLEPIPLTPEILEKNGFRIIFEGELHVSYFQDIERFHIEVKVDKIGIYQKLSMLDDLGNGATIVECKYVHQLQHALRLCGIEKEIIL